VSPTRPFDPEHDAPLLSAYVDGELEADDAARVEAYLADSAAGRHEVQRLRELRALTDQLQLRPAPPEAWEAFWSRHYNRAERSLGWFVFGIGVIVLATWGLFRAALALLDTPVLPWWVKGGILAVAAGLVILLVSVVRERVYVWRKTRYRDVVR
jgi:anti-sigma factor RsiW